MGGNALSYTTVRLTKKNYTRMAADCVAKLRAARRILRKPGHCSPGAPPRHSVLEASPLKVASAADC